MGLQELEALPADVKEGGGAWKLCRMETAPGVGLRAGEGCWEKGGCLGSSVGREGSAGAVLSWEHGRVSGA